MQGENPHISVVSPVFQAEEIVEELVKRISEEASKITQDFEIILIEDGSSDQSWQRIVEQCKIDKRVKGIKLSRNFGQHYAITAGLEESRGEYVIVMDCDLQDNPKYIHDLITKSKEGFDIILTKHDNREHGIVKYIFSILYYRFYNSLIRNDILMVDSQYSMLSLLSRKVVIAFLEYDDFHRSFHSIIHWLGYSTAEINIFREKRYKGKTSYTNKKLFYLAIDGVISQSDKLLRFSIYSGLTFTFIGFLSIIYIIKEYFLTTLLTGWASTMVLTITCTGIILTSLGIIGIYISKIFDQSKGRPLYIIDKLVNIEKLDK